MGIGTHKKECVKCFSKQKSFPKAEIFPPQIHLHPATLNIIRSIIKRSFLHLVAPAYPHQPHLLTLPFPYFTFQPLLHLQEHRTNYSL